MFRPKIYKKNGQEAFRLVGSDGSEFFYEGSIDCDDRELYKDDKGRLYYPVVAEIGSAINYFVELDPQVTQIPVAEEGSWDKVASRLVNSSPRTEAQLPDDVYVMPAASEGTAPAAPAETSPVTPRERLQAISPEMRRPAPAAGPATAGGEPVPQAAMPAMDDENARAARPEASEAIHAIFSPNGDQVRPPAESPGATAGPPGGGAPRQQPRGQRSLKWPLAIGAIVLLLAAGAIGVYVVEPAAYGGLQSMFAGPTATPVPTAAPTAEPSPSPTPRPSPTAAPDDAGLPTGIYALIDSDSPVVQDFARDHTGAASAGSPLRQTCDLFSYVNGRWKSSGNYPQPRLASEIAGSLEGTQKDYTVLMIALMESLDIEGRIILSYSGDILRYYPEIMAANTSGGFQAALTQLQAWYGVASPQGHSDDRGYWIALDMGDHPGIKPGDVTAEYALDGGVIIPLR